jgi:hypothetical protein
MFTADAGADCSCRGLCQPAGTRPVVLAQAGPADTIVGSVAWDPQKSLRPVVVEPFLAVLEVLDNGMAGSRVALGGMLVR